jgi:hypothetical protein
LSSLEDSLRNRSPPEARPTTPPNTVSGSVLVPGKRFTTR